MPRSSFCGYSYLYISVKGNETITGAGKCPGASRSNIVFFTLEFVFIDGITEKNNSQIAEMQR